MSEPNNHDRRDRRKPRQTAPLHRPVIAGGHAKQPRNSEVLVHSDPAAGSARIAKVMARAGLCSRRDAETWIRSGRVNVNGVTLTSPAHNVATGDTIYVDGEPIEAREPTRLFLFHKPRGCVTTARDPQHRPTVFDLLPKHLPRLIAVGRLDINTQGLLLLTNDGGLARVLELPKTGWLRRYRVRANGATNQLALDSLAAGVSLDGMNYGPIEARLDRVQGANVWLTIGLREGKNREVKRVLESLGLIVNRLIRVSFGPFQLGDLAEGAVHEVKTRVLKDQLGDAILRAAKADFAAPRSPTRSHRRNFVEIESAPEPPHRGRPERGKRKHISVLRAERRVTSRLSEPFEQGSTIDRKGRRVAVERLIARDAATSRMEGAPHGRSGNRIEQKRARSGSGNAARPSGADRRSGTAEPKKPSADKKQRWSRRGKDERQSATVSASPQKAWHKRRRENSRSHPTAGPRR
jgi:23S rRNA pseudouridine2605 synthase